VHLEERSRDRTIWLYKMLEHFKLS
jgi:hypothetical protein